MVSKLIYMFLIAISILISALVAEKTVKKRKGKIPVAFALFACLMIAFSVVSNPVINHIAKFKTPESAFKFSHSEEIVDVVEGQESCMIIYKTNNYNLGQDFILKSGDRYEILRSFSFKRVSNTVAAKGGIDVYNVKKTKDYYITGLLIETDEDSLAVFNNKNEGVKNFVISDLETGNGKVKHIFLYDTVYGSIDDYCLIINGEKISFNKS